MSLNLRDRVATGGRAADEMQEQNRFSGGGWQTVNWFSLEDKETRFYRFLTDASEWPSVMQHPFVPTRPVPDNWTDEQKKKWPSTFNPVCRRTPQFLELFPDGCYICDEMHTVRPNARSKNGRYYGQVRVWALAVEREEVRATTQALADEYGIARGEVIGYRDMEVEVAERDKDGKETGKKTMKKKIIVFNMALKNFFGPMQGYADAYKGTVLDRDYMVTRKGTGTNTDYNIAPLDPIPNEDGSRYDMRQIVDVEILTEDQATRLGGKIGEHVEAELRERYYPDGPDLYQLIEDRIDDACYDKFFDDRHPFPDVHKPKDDGGDGGSSKGLSTSAKSEPAPEKEPVSAADQAATQDRLAAMRSRVRGDNPPQGQSQDGAGEQDEAEPPAKAPARSGPRAL